MNTRVSILTSSARKSSGNILAHINFPIHKGVKTTFSAYPHDDKNKTGFVVVF